MRAQAATEYLIILAVVVIIALIVVGVLGGFQTITGGISRQQSEAYWSGAEIGILPNYLINASGAYLTIKNNKAFAINVESVQLDDSGTLTPSPVYLTPGSTADVEVSGIACTQGQQFSYTVTIKYSDPTTGRVFVFTGATPLVGVCQ